MKVLKTEKKLCFCCMEEHDVQTIEVVDTITFKDERVSFNAKYEYCDNTGEDLETEDFIRSNSLNMKDAYRKKVGLLTSSDIIDIREKYSVSQKDFSKILGWGEATITRYENHQVQDRIHDDMLRKIDEDPKWFLTIIERAKDKLSDKAYKKYVKATREDFKRRHNQYLIDYIESVYADLDDENINGGVKLNLNKVVDMINYLALKVKSLHKVKLMKLLWYSDSYHYKKHKVAISGLVYNSLPMGAVPIAHDQIINLDGVVYESVTYEDIAYKFRPVEGFEVKSLKDEEIETMDYVIEKLGSLKTRDIVEQMHAEDAYKCTDEKCIISFSYAEVLKLV